MSRELASVTDAKRARCISGLMLSKFLNESVAVRYEEVIYMGSENLSDYIDVMASLIFIVKMYKSIETEPNSDPNPVDELNSHLTSQFLSFYEIKDFVRSNTDLLSDKGRKVFILGSNKTSDTIRLAIKDTSKGFAKCNVKHPASGSGALPSDLKKKDPNVQIVKAFENDDHILVMSQGDLIAIKLASEGRNSALFLSVNGDDIFAEDSRGSKTRIQLDNDTIKRISNIRDMK
jgi:hypothetical protein